jgi:hypothetical protein
MYSLNVTEIRGKRRVTIWVSRKSVYREAACFIENKLHVSHSAKFSDVFRFLPGSSSSYASNGLRSTAVVAVAVRLNPSCTWNLQSEDRKLLQIDTKIIKVNMNYNNICLMSTFTTPYILLALYRTARYISQSNNRKARTTIVHIATANQLKLQKTVARWI